MHRNSGSRVSPLEKRRSAIHQVLRTILPDSKRHTLLQQNHTGKSVVQIPEVHAANTALVVELAVYVKGLVGRDFELAHPLTGHRSVLERRVKLVAPW